MGVDQTTKMVISAWNFFKRVIVTVGSENIRIENILSIWVYDKSILNSLQLFPYFWNHFKKFTQEITNYTCIPLVFVGLPTKFIFFRFRRKVVGDFFLFKDLFNSALCGLICEKKSWEISLSDVINDSLLVPWLARHLSRF